jgi:hypothetical protein
MFISLGYEDVAICGGANDEMPPVEASRRGGGEL